MKNKITQLPSQVKYNKNKKLLKKINKTIDRLEKQVTKMLQVSQKLQALKVTVAKQVA